MENNVLWITYSPSPYRVNFFNLLGKKCNLKVIFQVKCTKNRNKEWFDNSFLSFTGLFNTKKYKKLVKKEEFDRIVIHSFSNFKSLSLARYLIKHKIPYILEADGAIYKKKNIIIEKIKKYLISNASYLFSTSTSSDNYFLKYGAKKTRIIFYHFSSLFEADILKKPLSKKEKNELKKNNGIKEEKIVLTVGQFIYRKGFDLLLNSIKNNEKVGYYFVGGVPTQQYLDIVTERKLKNVHFIGYQNKEQINNYYMMADLFVLPTREDIWGLVINEALAKGLPVISTKYCVAAQELIKNNGIILDELNEDNVQNAIDSMIFDDVTLNNYSKNSIKIICDYTIENMVVDHKLLYSKK